MPPLPLTLILDFLGIFTAALDGALLAIRDPRREFDIIGVTGLALATALGGGLTRDILLARGTPLALADSRYLAVALAAAPLAVLLHRYLGRRAAQTILLLDAAALGLFAVAGATRAHHAGLDLLPSLLLAVITAAGGGAWRDVLSGCPPRIFLRGQLYAFCALAAALVYLLLERAGLAPSTAATLGTLTGFLFRALTVHFNWQTRPVADPRLGTLPD